MEIIFTKVDWIVFGIATFHAIVFLQSGLDKIFNFKGNLEWLSGHFAESPLKGMVPFLVVSLTILEMSAGLASVAGVLFAFGMCSIACFQLSVVLALLSYLALFFGQRMAKDYAGAATIVSYFTVAIIAAFYCFWIY